MDESTLKCPYCQKEQYCHEPDEIDALMANTQCEYCGKIFEYSVSVIRMYDSREID
jgi:uncharacterized Zn-finger protein